MGFFFINQHRQPRNPRNPVVRERIKQRRQQTKRSIQRSVDRSRDDLIPADPVVIQLFSSLQLAKHARIRAPERQAFKYLINYLLTLERPPIRI